MVANVPPAQGEFTARWRLLLALAAGLSLGLLAGMVGALEFKFQLVIVGLLGLLLIAALARDKWLFFLLAFLVTLPVEVRKALSGTLELVMTGAPGPYFSSTDVLLIIVYGLWTARGHFLVDVRRTFFSTPNLIALLVIAATLPSLVNAEALHRSFWELTRLVRVYALFFYGLNCFRRRDYAKYVVGALLFTALLESAVAIAQAVTKKGLVLDLLAQEATLYVRDYANREVVRVSGTVIEPNSFAALMTLVGAVALGVALFERHRPVRAIGLLAYAGVVASTALSLSRSGIIALAVATVLVVALGLAARRISPGTVLSVALAGIVLATIAWFPVRGALAAKLEDQAMEWEGRAGLHETALNMWADHP